jgi:hypothetical protein
MCKWTFNNAIIRRTMSDWKTSFYRVADERKFEFPPVPLLQEEPRFSSWPLRLVSAVGPPQVFSEELATTSLNEHHPLVSWTASTPSAECGILKSRSSQKPKYEFIAVCGYNSWHDGSSVRNLVLAKRHIQDPGTSQGCAVDYHVLHNECLNHFHRGDGVPHVCFEKFQIQMCALGNRKWVSNRSFLFHQQLHFTCRCCQIFWFQLTGTAIEASMGFL